MKSKIIFIAGIVAVVAFLLFAVLPNLNIIKNINKALPVVSKKTDIDVKIIEEKLRLVAELATLTYDYSDVGIFSEEQTLSMFGSEIGIMGTKKSFIITYDGEMKFGVDLSEISVRENNNVLKITLAPAKMFSHEMKEDTIRLLDEKNGVFASSSVMDYAIFMKEQKEEMEEKALEKDLFSQAQLNAEKQIESFISAFINTDDEYEISFVK